LVQEASNNAFAIDILDRLADGQTVPQGELDELETRGYHLPLSVNEALSDLSSLDRRQRSLESFFFQLIDHQRQLGIASYLGF
jgi:hypothetical protein